MCDSMSGGYTLSVISDAPRKRREKRDCSSVTGRFWHGPRNPAWDRAIRRIGGQLGVVERVPSRFSLFLPSDPQISPGNVATVSICGSGRPKPPFGDKCHHEKDLTPFARPLNRSL